MGYELLPRHGSLTNRRFLLSLSATYPHHSHPWYPHLRTPSYPPLQGSPLEHLIRRASSVRSKSSCCPLCGHSLPYTHSGPSWTSTFGFSSLRGRNEDQVQESNGTVRHQVAAARLSSKPGFKIKGELESFHSLKANLDPG